MFLDFVATFPFEWFYDDVLFTRMIRLTRLSKLVSLLDNSRFKKIIKSYFDNSQRSDRIQTQYVVMYAYKIFRLVIIVVMITYFIGCFWWLIVRFINNDKDVLAKNTFITYNELDLLFDYSNDTRCGPIYCNEDKNSPDCMTNTWKKDNCDADVLTQVIIVCYFALTTLSTIGYGDLYPMSSREMMLGILFMLIGIVFFSQIMSSFIEIIQNYDQRMGNDDKGAGLNMWMNLLSRFTDKPLSKNLVNQIDRHFSFYWANNRLNTITKTDEYLNQIPR